MAAGKPKARPPVEPVKAQSRGQLGKSLMAMAALASPKKSKQQTKG